MIFFALPRLRVWLKRQLDEKLAAGGMPGTEFFLLTYYLDVTVYMDVVAFSYLIGAFLILLSPLDLWVVSTRGLWVASYIVILFGTSILLAMVIARFPAALSKTLALSKIMPS